MGKSVKLVDYKLGVHNLHMLLRKSDLIDRQNGINYYPDLSLRIGSVAAGHQYSKAIGVFAALSPNNSEGGNLGDVERMFAYHGKWKGENWSELKVHTYGANKSKAIRIIEGEDPDLVLTGPKTNSFYHNLLDPYDAKYVTVDGHIVGAWQGKRLPMDQSGINQAQYDLISWGLREVAGAGSVIELQATLWLTWRRINWVFYNPQYKLDF